MRGIPIQVQPDSPRIVLGEAHGRENPGSGSSRSKEKQGQPAGKRLKEKERENFQRIATAYGRSIPKTAAARRL